MLADDHAATRLGVRLALEEGGFDVVAEAVDARGAIEAALEHRPDLCLLDVYMPGHGIAAAAELTEVLPDMPIVMLTVSDTDEDLFDALRAGACGYLLKDASINDVVAGVRAAAVGASSISPRVAAKLVDAIRAEQRARQASEQTASAELSPREIQVLRLVAQGKENSEIARELFISPQTVKNHISHILVKLGVDNRIQAAVHAVRSKLV